MSMNPIRFNRARTTPYFDSVSLINSIEGPEVIIDQRIACLSFQGYVTSGTPVGTIKAQLSIIENVWTDLAGCEPITVDLGLNNDFMMIIPDQSAYAGKIRLVWTAGDGSSGSMTVAKRIMLP